MKIETMTMESPEYPEHLKSIPDAPEKLYYSGDIGIIEHPLIAVVGTRRCSPYGRWAAEKISEKIARCGVSVVSGMASGIDTAAHRGCIKGGMPTIAVLGTGVDICFPSSNRQLYERIAAEGLLISEYPPGEGGRPAYFPQRNRIISGLSKSVIVVEGAPRSGSMITARLALEQGRDVFAVPGNIDQPNSLGVNKLIADGAYPILELESVCEVLGIGVTEKQKIIRTLSEEEIMLLGFISEQPGMTIEYAAFKTGFDYLTASTLASGLELKGLVSLRGQRVFLQK
ncbi:MAG: DNA-processing protein DprA [Firmicutes bacterium]|nr:DNA-processing protein DprA [Bacillota bacterium]